MTSSTDTAGLPTAALDYELDSSLIATMPASPRDGARMLVFHRAADRVEHRLVRDLPDYLIPGSAMVVNETRVAPLRFVARRRRDGRLTEGLFLVAAGEGWWEILLRGARRFRTGDELELLAPGDEAPHGDAIEIRQTDARVWQARFLGGVAAATGWQRSGRTPLPPYILEARRLRHEADPGESRDRADYQTVFAAPGSESSLTSCAAPTAGLHFTRELLAEIERRGVGRVAVELQVGPGTFKPVESERLSDHAMHEEQCIIRARTAVQLAAWDPAVSLVVGTTSVRCLESISRPLPAPMLERARSAIAQGDPSREVEAFGTRLLITPGFEFLWTHRLLTNFHLPRSTLLALVGGLVGLDRLKSLYALAQQERYRFYSLGDAMLILP